MPTISPLRLLLALPLALGLTAATAHAREFAAIGFGAKPDGVTLNTAAIQRAIDAAAKEPGSAVVFTPGTYLTGSIFVKTGVTLRLDKGVTLLGSQHIEDYPLLPTASPASR